MRTESVRRLFDAVLDYFCEVVITEASVFTSFKTAKDPLLGWSLCKVVTEYLESPLVCNAYHGKG